MTVLPPCREGATPEDLAREANRSVLYGACLKAIRPDARIKPEIVDAVAALVPGVQSLFAGNDNSSAQFVREYAVACGGAPFLAAKIAEYRARQNRMLDSSK